jgi:uncharacterized membrane protein (UPF0127 family)
MDVVTVERTDGVVVCARCEVADNPVTRMRGLLGRSRLDPDAGLLIRPTNSVHTAFMRFPIDVVFFDRELRVLRIAHELPAWRAAARRGAKGVIELPAGAAARVGLAEGDELRLRD